MSTTDGPTASIGEVNPFSPIAVAKVMEDDWANIVTVPTPQIANALGIVDGYLAVHAPTPSEDPAAPMRPTAGGPGGTVLAVVGDYGTGKTHLVVHLLRHVRREAGDRVRCVYLEANSDSFRTVYKRFIEKLDPDEIRDRVKQYYAEVVADSLGDTELTLGIVENLRLGGADPTLVVENFALLESTLLRDLRERLRTVTQNSAFATMLMLLLRPGFEASAWGWLEGHEPDDVLRERGITSKIDTDAAALEAMGVIALLHRTGDRRFLLAIDELDRVLSTATNPGADVLTAFKQLLQVFTAAGAMLVLAGLPDFLDTVSPETLERIGSVVRMGTLTVDDTRTLIEASQEQVLKRRRLEPFTEEAVRHVVLLSRGTARQVIRLLYNAFRHASEAGTPVTVGILDEVARSEQYLPLTDDDVRDLVRDVLRRNGWPFRINYQLKADPPILVDYWLAPGGGSDGYAVLVTGSVVDDKDVARLRAKAGAIAELSGDERARVRVLGTLLVVNGYLHADLADELNAVFGARPVLYESRSFAGNLAAALSSLTNLPIVTGTDSMAQVTERVDRINRQQATMHGHLEAVTRLLDDLRSASERRLDEITGQLRALLAARPAAAPEPEATGGRAGLPREVDRLFADAFEAVAELDRFDALLRDAFGIGEQSEVSGTRKAIRARLSVPERTQAAGVAILMRKTIGTFREGAEAWYRSQLARGSLPGAVDRDRLDTICGTYDAISEYLPAFHLAELAELAVAPGGDADLALRAQRRVRQARMRDILANLSLRVRDGLLRAVTPPG